MSACDEIIDLKDKVTALEAEIEEVKQERDRWQRRASTFASESLKFATASLTNQRAVAEAEGVAVQGLVALALQHLKTRDSGHVDHAVRILRSILDLGHVRAEEHEALLGLEVPLRRTVAILESSRRAPVMLHGPNMTCDCGYCTAVEALAHLAEVRGKTKSES